MVVLGNLLVDHRGARMFALGIDVGGTKIEAALLEIQKNSTSEGFQEFYLPASGQTKPPISGSFRCLERQRIPTLRLRGYEAVMEDMCALIQRILQEHNLSPNDISGIGLAIPGSIDPVRKVMVSGNTGIFIGQDLTSYLQQRLSWQGPIFIENDANCFAWAEACAGVGRRFGTTLDNKVLLGVILGTGVGGGCVVHGRLLQGRRGGGAEWGHTILYPHGAPCYCGNSGCAERYLSGTALEALYGQQMYQHISERPKAEEIFALADAWEPMAIAVVTQYRKNLARFLATLCQCFDPDLIVLGAGVSRQARIYQGLSEELRPLLFVKDSPPEVVPHSLGDSAGVLGAALLVPRGLPFAQHHR
jgi:fructokinase